MKVKDTFPIISDIIVIIEDVKCKDTLCTIEVTRHFDRYNGDTPLFSSTRACCDKPYFKMGRVFWKDEFGTRQVNRIEKLCDEAVKNYLEKEDLR